MNKQHKALELADNIDAFSGYCTSHAAETIRRQHALIVQMRDALGRVCSHGIRPSSQIDADWDAARAVITAATQYLEQP